MFKKILTVITLVLLFFLLFYRLGDDSVTTDDKHFKDWSYVFMKEFEEGHFDRLYVTVQPGVLTIYSNILGFKSFHFLKDRLGFFQNLNAREVELYLHAFSKIPKSFMVFGLLFISYILVKRSYGGLTGLVFLILFGLEPFVLANSRVIQTDILPAYLCFIAALFLYLTIRKDTFVKVSSFMLIGIFVGLACVEKASALIFVPLSIGLIFFGSGFSWKDRFKHASVVLLSFLLTIVLVFPAFWGDFWFTLWRLTVGSFVQGVKGLDAETFSYALTPHTHPWYFYFRFFLNQLSEFIFLGFGLAFFLAYEKRHSIKVNFHTLKSFIFNPLFLVPIAFFCMHQLAVKKGARFMLYIFPFLALYASLAYSKIVKRKTHLFLFFIFVIGIRLIQFTFLFPDFILYKNPLSLDFGYAGTYAPFGAGYRKLADYLITQYGEERKVHLGDHENLKLFYPGMVGNFDNKDCSGSFDLVIQTSKFPKESCYLTKLLLDSTFSPVKRLTFYVYKSR